MKKIALVTIIAILFCFPSYSQVEYYNDYNAMTEQLKKNKYSSIIGEYYLFDFKVKISTNKDDKLILTIPTISKQAEKCLGVVSDLNLSISQGFPNGIFPLQGSYELIPISHSIFIIKYSGGISIELKKLDSSFEQELVLHDSDFDVINYGTFYKILFSSKNILSINENIQYKQLKKDIQQVKFNMYHLKISLETYFIDFDGIYPNNLNDLIQEAKSKGYWKEIINPFTKKSGISKEGSMLELKSYRELPISPPGLVIFEPINCSYDKNIKSNICSSYRIYGTDEKGEFIKIIGSNIYISNE